MQSFLLHGFLETLPHMALISLQVYLLTDFLTYLFIYLFIYLLIYFTQNNCLLIFLEAPHPRFTHASGQGVTSRRR